MINMQLLENEIKDSGLKKGYIANKMGLTTQGLSKKIKKCRLTTDEADALCKIIGICSDKKKCEIFFASNVDKNGNIFGG